MTPRNTTIFIQAIQLGLAFTLASFIFSYRIFPYADDWSYIGARALGSNLDFLHWVFSQHVDHRIPIQKLFHFLLAKLAGYDFRILILANIVLACVASSLLLAAAKNYRGQQTLGDLIIPLIILCPVAGYSLWAFQLQFLSSILFASASLYFSTKYTQSNQGIYFHASMTALLLCSLCGMNGLILSLVTSAATLLYFFIHKKKSAKSNLIYTSFVIAVNLGLLAFWTPSGAAGAASSASATAEIFFHLVGSSMVIYLFNGAFWKPLLVFTVVAGAAVISLNMLRKKAQDISEYIIAGILLGSMLVLLSIAFGRGKTHDGWSNVFAMHYGFLATLLPITAWIIISKRIPKSICLTSGLALTIIFSLSYKENLDWRKSFFNDWIVRQQDIARDMRTEHNLEILTQRYRLDFTWSGANDLGHVVNGLKILRAAEYPLYSPPKSR